MPGPMEGVRVVELGVWVAGPAAGGILADWGADVVKIEPPAGDPARQFARMLGGDLPYNPPFELDSRGKRSIVVDLGSDAGHQLALELLDGADVFVTNVRVPALERLGLAYEQLCERLPRLVYALITGYGLEGDEGGRAAYDVGAFWARSGIVELLTTPGGPPPFQRGGMGDHPVGVSLTAGIGAALFARERTGRGQLVSTSLLRQGLYTIGFDLNTALRFGIPIGTPTHETMGNPMINYYTDRDGRRFWLIGLEGDRHWPDLCRAVDRAEWTTDPRFESGVARAQNCGELTALLDGIFATRTRAEWGEIFDRENLWWAPVQTTDEVLADPQVKAAGGFTDVPDGTGTTTMMATPVDFSATPWSTTAMPPELGEHTDEILRELGRDDAAIAELRAAKVVA